MNSQQQQQQQQQPQSHSPEISIQDLHALMLKLLQRFDEVFPPASTDRVNESGIVSTLYVILLLLSCLNIFYSL